MKNECLLTTVGSCINTDDAKPFHHAEIQATPADAESASVQNLSRIQVLHE